MILFPSIDGLDDNLRPVLEALPLVFIVKRGFTPGQLGLTFIGVGIGVVLAGFLFVYQGRNYAELQKKWNGFPPPEERLYGAMFAGPLLVIGIFWLGWSGEYSSVPWYVPALATIPIGASVCLVFVSFMASFFLALFITILIFNNRVIQPTHTCMGNHLTFTTQIPDKNLQDVYSVRVLRHNHSAKLGWRGFPSIHDSNVHWGKSRITLS